jgi:MFS transporter, ACS family, hexuronate transporter
MRKEYLMIPMSAEPTPLTPLRAWAVTITATLVMAVSYVDRQTLAALSPTVREALHINHAEYGWLTGAFSLAYLAIAPISGSLIDRIGCRMGLVVAVLVWSVVSGLHALVPTFAALFVLRIALGMAESPSFPGAAQAVRRALPVHRRSAGFGLLFTGGSLGATISAPLAVGILKYGSWRMAFVGTAIVGLVWIPLWLLVTGSRATRDALAVAPPDPLAAEPAEPWHRLIRDPAVIRGLLLILASAPALSFILNWLPQYLVAEQHLTQMTLAGYVWVPMLFYDLGAVGFGALASVRERTPARAHVSHRGLVAIAGVGCATIALMPLADGPWAAVLIASVAGAGGGGLYALLTADMLGRVAPSRVSIAGGLCAAAQSLAYVVANPLVGASVDRTGRYTVALIALGAVVAPGAVAWMLWPVRSPRRA